MAQLVPDHDPAGDKALVLVVDDVLEARLLIRGILRPLGVEIREADSGETALRFARLAPQPDLIVLDVMMPGMDGHQTLRALRADPVTREIPVIFVTAAEGTDDEERGLAEGAVDFLAKPVRAAVLKARAAAQLELHRRRRHEAGQKAWLEQEVARRVAENSRLETRLQLALAATGFGIWEYSHDNGHCDWNESLCALVGLPGEGPMTMAACLERVHPEDRPRLERGIAEGALSEECRIRHQDGRWLWAEVRGRVVRRHPDGRPIQTLGIITDITARKEAEAAQRLSGAVFAGVGEGICITDAQSRILLTNAAFCRLTGYDPAETTGQTPRLLQSGKHGPEFYRAMWEAVAAFGNWQGEITNRHKDGRLIAHWLSISAVRDPSGQISNYVGVFNDMSERKAAAERIQYLSSFDHLTGLPNRALFADRLAQAMLNARRFSRDTAVMLLDLDHFHLVNETLGPPAGDAVLVEMARRLSLQVRDGDTVGRRSGNEFGFVMANLSHELDVVALAQRMLEAIAVPVDHGGQSLAITGSIGVAVGPRDGDSADALLKSADAALMRAKSAGRNSFAFYSPDMEADAARHLSLEAALRLALSREELSVVYQPQVSLDSGNIIGMEALLRWNSGEFGAVTPGEFIPIAEETGLIHPIGTWVLREACEQTRRWLDLGHGHLRVAVNLSARQFRQANLVELVSQVLAETGLPAAALEVEITESALIDDVDQAIDQCRALKALGVRLSLDDFGTGYSSLAYISRFPIDKLKIDQSFIRDIVENPVNAAIATAAIVMARSLNLAVLAEGVETEAQASFLRGRHCDAIQGFLFSHPLSPEDFAQLLTHQRKLVVANQVSEEGPTLLIVDDEPNILSALSRLLRREGYHILTCTSPLAAFDLLAKHPVQVIVSDQRMPDMTGTEFFARVRQLYPDTVRLVLTGYTELDSVTSAINQGAIYKFLTKPWDDDLLREQIREAFRLAADRQPPANTTPPGLSSSP